MSNEFDKRQLKEFHNNLKFFYEKINSEKKLSKEEIDEANSIINTYYNYLIECNIKYGKAAFDVANNLNSFGHFANKYFEVVLQEKQKLSNDDIINIRDNYKLMLAYKDTEYRMNKAKA